ncbi:DUF1801 domain-containing protein [Gulosibacter sp. ACHW.36C]|uniref:DUF1801 domain-containing protein n=1 Tax=Gulosibacter sediminis TaxID=1729695 RepID=A0ABY4MX08_9MICO|nr:DUF1801 domain-containing protein [Gulosibacter sediminis]UQN13931.1 DUF1801 domain-containing protein [Gulosibacter sediminis]
MASEIKTKPTDVDPRDFIAALPTPRRRDEGATLLELFEAVTGEPAVMWGPSMVGFGETDYTNTMGTNSWFKVGFSPRKAKLTFYGLQGYTHQPEALERLGKHTLGAGCVYANSLKDLDLDVLRELVALGWAAQAEGDGAAS